MPWHVASFTAGFIRLDRVPIAEQSTAFTSDFGRLEIRGENFATRSDAIDRLFEQLVAQGICRRRHELFAVAPQNETNLSLQIDRGGVAWFGVRPIGVHLTGYVHTPKGLFVWVGVRARDKLTYPGRWDNTVAGGQPIGLSLRDNLTKECGEEAAIPAALARLAVPTSTIRYLREDESGLKPDTLHCFDLALPADFTPRPVDGEVEQFLLLPAREVAEVVRDTQRCKPNCNLVWIDFFLRHHVLDGELSQSEQAELYRQLTPLLP